MAKYILKRVLMAVITLFIVICLTFFPDECRSGQPVAVGEDSDSGHH